MISVTVRRDKARDDRPSRPAKAHEAEDSAKCTRHAVQGVQCVHVIASLCKAWGTMLIGSGGCEKLRIPHSHYTAVHKPVYIGLPEDVQRHVLRAAPACLKDAIDAALQEEDIGSYLQAIFLHRACSKQSFLVPRLA